MVNDMERAETWSRFWATGAGHSCSGSFALDGEGELAGFWREAFDAMTGDGLVVDMATGNGGLLSLAHDHAHARGLAWKLHGVDMARLSPAWLDEGRHRNVHFHGQTPMESTGMETGSASLVVSQYGVEYASRPEVQTECQRLLKPGGRFAFIIHHVDSEITRVAHDEAEVQSFLLADGGMLEAARQLLPHLAAVRGGAQPRPQAHAARQQFNACMEAGSQIAARLTAPDLLVQSAAVVQQVLASVNKENVDQLLDGLSKYRDEIIMSRLRTDEQIESAMDKKALDTFVLPFEEAGFQVNVRLLHESGHMVGWGVTGEPVQPEG